MILHNEKRPHLEGLDLDGSRDGPGLGSDPDAPAATFRGEVLAHELSFRDEPRQRHLRDLGCGVACEVRRIRLQALHCVSKQ